MINLTNTYKTQLSELKKKLEHSVGLSRDQSLFDDIKEINKKAERIPWISVGE